MSSEQVYQGGDYLHHGGYLIPGSGLAGLQPVGMLAVRSNQIHFDPEVVLAPDPISDACGRLAAFCIDGYPILGYDKPLSRRIADLGTGSGVFLTSTINGLKIPTDRELQIHAIDIDSNALQTAERNIIDAASRAPRPIVLACDNKDYGESLTGKYDLIYFNPPYLKRGDKITDPNARLAPQSAIYIENPAQEFARIVPNLREFLEERGVAFVRLPRESDIVDAWLADYIEQNEKDRIMLVTAGPAHRQGRFLAVTNGQLPDAFGQYDYWENYLGGHERRRRAKSELIPIYHDDDCEVELVKGIATERYLSGKALAS